MRVEADEVTRCRDRREQVPAEVAIRCTTLAGVAADLALPAMPSHGYRALLAAERQRAGGTDDAIALAAVTGTGAILVEVLTETSLQRTLPAGVFGRAYGLALPASMAGIVAARSSPRCWPACSAGPGP